MRAIKPKLYQRNLEAEYLKSGAKSLSEFWELQAKEAEELGAILSTEN